MSTIEEAIEQSSEAVDALARRTGFSPEAVESMRRSVARGGGRMAQFDHREFGGMGQWMRGGLLMIGDSSNHELKRRIDELCDELCADLFVDEAGRDSTGDGDRLEQPTWYLASLGTPDTSGAQNDLRYAWFASKRTLAVDRGGVVTLYDTADHRIGGVSQQQGFDQTLAFASQHGDIDLDRLPVVAGDGRPAHHGDEVDAREPDREPVARDQAEAGAVDPFIAIEKLADLHARGILDTAEFADKKRELLKRI